LKQRATKQPALVEVNATSIPKPDHFPWHNGDHWIFGTKKITRPTGFDNYQSGKIGGIREICVITKHRSGVEEIDAIRANFAGKRVSMGDMLKIRATGGMYDFRPDGGRPRPECWSLRENDVITQIEVWTGDRVRGFRFRTSLGNTSPRWGSAMGDKHTWTSPRWSGDHLLGFYGQIDGNDGIHRLGFFVGQEQ